MSWQKKTLRRSHTRHKQHKNTPHQQEKRGPVRVQKGLRTDSQGKVSKASEDQRRAARERTRAVGRRRGTRSLHTQSLPGIDARGKRTGERREALTCSHARHCRHVPAANVLVERIRLIEHCAGPTRATKQHKTHHTNKKNEARSEFKKGLRTDSQGKASKASEDQRRAARERTAAVGCRRGTRPLHTQSLRGSMKEGKERARVGRHLLDLMVVTADTPQRPMSWLNAFA
jgi:hypothetical protein